MPICMQHMYPFCNHFIIYAGHNDCWGGGACLWGVNRQGQLTATRGMFVRTSAGTLHLTWWCFFSSLALSGRQKESTLWSLFTATMVSIMAKNTSNLTSCTERMHARGPKKMRRHAILQVRKVTFKTVSNFLLRMYYRS